MGIKKVSGEELDSIIDKREPIGLFYCKDGRVWVAVDNSTGDAWTEEFKSESAARAWLVGAIKSPSERMASAARAKREWLKEERK